MRDSGKIFRYGDSSSSTASACFSVPSKTTSPVVLTKSASRTLSFSVSFADCRERKYNPPAISAASPTRIGTASTFQDLFPAAVLVSTLPALEEGTATCAELAAGTGGTILFDPVSCAPAPQPHPL